MISWKHIAPTRPSFDELRTTIKQYGGRDRDLSVIPNEFVSEWAAHDFKWFRNASDEERAQVVGIAGGWPEAISEWKTQGVDRFDPERLRQITDDSVKGRYASLEAELTDQAVAKDRPRLYQLSIMPKILTELALARLWNCEAQEVHDFLRFWSGHALLKKENGRYLFAHEKKHDVARRVLGDALFNGGQSAARALYDFYLSNVGFPTEAQPESAYYLYFALTLKPWAGLTEDEAALLGGSVSMALDAGARPQLSDRVVQVALKAPWNTRFVLYHLAASGLPETADLLEAIGDGVLDDQAAMKSDPLNFAQGLVNASNDYGKAERLVEVERLLQRLGDLVELHPGQVEIALRLAQGLFNASHDYGKAERLVEVERLLQRLGDLVELHPGQAEIALELAKGLFNASVYYGNAERLEEVERLLQRLGDLAGKFPEDAPVTAQFARGLLLAGMLKIGDVERKASELSALIEKFGDSDAFGPVLALVEQLNQQRGSGDESQTTDES